MSGLVAVRGAVDRLLDGEAGPLLGLLAEDVRFEVHFGDDVPGPWCGRGVAAVADYFTALGALPSFWQLDYGVAPGRVIAWGRERYTVEGCGLEGASEFALVFELADGMVTRLRVIEDLPAYLRGGARLSPREAA